jgi:hypothetical protein
MGRNNAAGRLHTLLKKASQVSGLSVPDGWCSVFQIPGGVEGPREREIARMLTLMHNELDDIRAELGRTDIDRDTYESTLNRISNALSLKLFTAGWDSVKQHLSPEAMGVFAFIVQVLPADEEPLDEAELAELQKYVTSALAVLASGDLPEWAKQVLRTQYSIVLQALRDYPVRGAAAFRDASIRAVVEWEAHSDRMQTYADRPEVASVKELWPQIVKYGKRVALIHAFVAALLGTAKLGLDVVEEVRLLQAGDLSVDVNRRKLPPQKPRQESGGSATPEAR